MKAKENVSERGLKGRRGRVGLPRPKRNALCDRDCVVQPLYLPGTKKPYIVTASQAKTGFGPTCPSAGDAGVGCKN